MRKTGAATLTSMSLRQVSAVSVARLSVSKAEAELTSAVTG